MSKAANKVAPKAANTPNNLQVLLQIEGEALAAKDHIDLKHLAVNRPRALLSCGHIMWVRRAGRKAYVEAISGQESFDKNTPFAHWVMEQLGSRAKSGALDQPLAFTLESRRTDDGFDYPFSAATFIPFSPNPRLGGLLFTADKPFAETQLPIMTRLTHLFGIKDAALRGRKRARMSHRKRNIMLGVCGLLILAAFIPVPMTSLAPAEVVASDPKIVTAPMDGVVQEILVPPNSLVTKGTALIRFEDVELRNEFLLAQQELQLADVRRRQAGLSAFIDGAAKREIAVADAEAKLASAKLNYARDRLSRTVILAPEDGLALYTNPSDWTGRPVATGEAIIKIAEPTRVLLRIDAPLAHGEALQGGARVRMFLDADPVNALEAKLDRASYHAAPTPDGGMAFEAYAAFDDAAAQPRIGARGVAKIYSDAAPLGYWLARRPITLARQMTGL